MFLSEITPEKASNCVPEASFLG